MKNIKIEKGMMTCKNEKYSIKFTAIGMAAVKCGWSKIPTVAQFVKYGATAEDHTALMSACNAVYQYLRTLVEASHAHGAGAGCENSAAYREAQDATVKAMRNLSALLGQRVDKVGHISKYSFVADSQTIPALILVMGNRGKVVARETFICKMIPFIILMMRGDALTTETVTKAVSDARDDGKKAAAPDEKKKRGAKVDSLENNVLADAIGVLSELRVYMDAHKGAINEKEIRDILGI